MNEKGLLNFTWRGTLFLGKSDLHGIGRCNFETLKGILSRTCLNICLKLNKSDVMAAWNQTHFLESRKPENKDKKGNPGDIENTLSQIFLKVCTLTRQLQSNIASIFTRTNLPLEKCDTLRVCWPKKNKKWNYPHVADSEFLQLSQDQIPGVFKEISRSFCFLHKIPFWKELVYMGII